MANNIFHGVPHNHQASGVFPSDPTITYFFYYDGVINKVYKHDSTSNTTTIHDIGSGANQLFPNLPTNQAMDRAVWSSNGHIYVKWEDSPGVYIQRQYNNATSNPQGVTGTPSDALHNATTSNTSYSIGISPSLLSVFLPNNGWTLDHQYNQGSWGGTTAYYTGLPQTQHRSMNMIPSNNNQILVFYDTGIVYTIDLSTKSVVSSAPYGATVVNIFDGVPWDHTASVGFDNDPTITYFFRMNPTTNYNQVFIHDETTNTTTISDIGIPTMFPDLPTNIPISHGTEGQPANLGEHLIFWVDSSLSPPLQFIVTTSPTAVPVFIGSQNLNEVYHTGSSIENPSTSSAWSVLFGWNFFYAARGSISHLLTTGNYGAVGQPYAGLPYIAGGPQVQTQYSSILRVTGQVDQVYLFTPTGDAIILDLLAQQISSTVPYGPIGPAPPVTPPTPLPDIEVVYQAPGQFNLFSSDVSLVTENQFGWNFTKTINDANKMELFLYASFAPGAVPFNYNDLLEITVNMKNNLVLTAGEIFMNVYTGPPTAPNWYYYKDTYNFSPALGTTIDAALVEHILTLSDTRTDPIVAISLHSNSAAQQVNCDVSDVSFTILFPANNTSQKVKVKLQNNFIVLDDNYWNLDNIATARLNTTIIPAFDIQEFNPNIVAGNFPQNATARESASGCALYTSGTWQLYETTDGTTWTATPNSTLTLIAQTTATPVPGPSSNGFAYIGTKGMFDNYGTALPVSKRPVAWENTTSNEFDFVWTGSAAQTLAPLAKMTTPNNFTGAQMASGYFDTVAAAGSTSVAVWISSATSPSGGPVASRDIEVVVKSETEISLKRSWELSVTTYIINPNNPKEITGQYTDPVYTTSVAPTSFSMPSNWIEVANNDFHFEILFSAGLNNSLPAESQNFRQMTVTPTPTNTEITFAWVANYYTAGNILIGPVAGIGTTGLVSGFTTGGTLKPANAAYILYGATSSENVDAFTSLVFIEPPITPPGEFSLLFGRGLINTIFSDALYTVSVDPVATGVTYTFTGKYYDVNNGFLGDVTFTPQATLVTFTFAFASMPAGAKYISFVGTSSEATTAQLSIALVEPPGPGPEPPGPPVVVSVTQEEAIISKINYHVDESHKIIDDSIVSEVVFTLTDSDGNVKYTNDNIYYELEIKEVDANP